MDSRTVNRSLIDAWIDKNSPYGHEQLSVKARIAYPTVGQIRRGKVPKTYLRRRLAEVMGHTEDELFPFVTANEEAS